MCPRVPGATPWRRARAPRTRPRRPRRRPRAAATTWRPAQEGNDRPSAAWPCARRARSARGTRGAPSLWVGSDGRGRRFCALGGSRGFARRASTFLGWSKIAPRSSGGDAHETAVFCARRWTQSVVLRDWRRLTGLLGAAKSLNCSKKPAPTYRQRTHYTTITTRSPRPPIHRLPPPRAAACRAQGQDSSRAVPATIAPRQKTPRPRP